MRRVAFSSHLQRAIALRLLVAWLGLVLCVAPQWHVCEDHGLALGAHAPACDCCLNGNHRASIHPSRSTQTTSQLQPDTHSSCFCLACYLEFFSLTVGVAFSLLALFRLLLLRFRAPLNLALLASPVRHASRGPPCFSF